MQQAATNYSDWALILGGSSGIGLASARKLAEEGMNICIVHRDRRADLPEIERAFDAIRTLGVEVITFNVNALLEEGQEKVIHALTDRLGTSGKISVLLHSIARGNLKPLASGVTDQTQLAPSELADRASVEQEDLVSVWENLQKSLAKGGHRASSLTAEDFRVTIHAMATSLLTWTHRCIDAKLFAADTRILGLTSEGNTKAWPSYAAVSAAKVTLEALARAMAVELAPLGIRTNLIQAGVTNTPSLRMIPGNEHLKLSAVIRNPFQRLTQPEDVANVVYLLTRKEAAWINGAIIPVDGGERLG